MQHAVNGPQAVPRESVIARPVCTRFAPQPDITAYELAQLIPHFIASSLPGRVLFMADQWAGMTPELRRHFQTV